jgi:nitric oxide reductase NorE protein
VGVSVTVRTDTDGARRSPIKTGHIPGELGVWVFILGDMVIFAVLFLTYLHYRGQQSDLFAASQATLSQNIGAAITVLLLFSSLLVVLALRAVRAQELAIARALLLAAFACGVGYSALKVIEYHDKVSHHMTPATNDFYMFYFVLTGLHWFHLALGMVVLLVLFLICRRPELTARQLGFVEGGTCFWHMIDLLWIVLFPLLYLVR